MPSRAPPTIRMILLREAEVREGRRVQRVAAGDVVRDVAARAVPREEAPRASIGSAPTRKGGSWPSS
jgi:hypothetical protein